VSEDKIFGLESVLWTATENCTIIIKTFTVDATGVSTIFPVI
jgi:hypothetical protein